MCNGLNSEVAIMILNNYKISRSFVEDWEPRYDAQKYPLDFYRKHRDGARGTEQPEQLKNHLLALLNWKDGKTKKFIEDGQNHAKPNIVNPILKLANIDLFYFAQLFRKLAQAEKNYDECMEEFCVELSGNMWKETTVVIPAFILHVARPDRLPIIDQHTVRAWLALTNRRDLSSRITWSRWKGYRDFFQDAVVKSGYDNNQDERCKVDRALFAYGKWLKASCSPQRKARRTKHRKSPQSKCKEKNGPHFWGKQVPHTGIIPTAANVVTALNDYLRLGALDNLPSWKRRNLRDLYFEDEDFKQSYTRPDLRELLQNPGGNMARNILRFYYEKRGEGKDIKNLPRPILDVFLVGWAYYCGYCGYSDMAKHLHDSGFGGTENASQAAVYVGRTTGQLFGLLDGNGKPTEFFQEYFNPGFPAPRPSFRNS